jgi:hypothetical protein
LLYTLEQGSVEQMIIQQCMREKLPLPDRIENAPQLTLGLELYYGAFFDLHTCRPLGMAEGAIRWMDIHDYCDRLELSLEQREDMHHHIRVMDNAYLEWRGKKAKNETLTTGRGGGKHG